MDASGGAAVAWRERGMEGGLADVPHCEEQLRSTLHGDNKEKLRRKLALLQREYLKTAQKLQRAERLEAVRNHVRSRITQQDHRDRGDPAGAPDLRPASAPPSPDTLSGEAPGPRSRRDTGAPADSENSKRSQVIRFLLPSDVACPSTPALGHDAGRGPRPSPALRLRSRRSRLRWEMRSAEEGQEEQSDRTEGGAEPEKEEEPKSQGTEVVNESEEILSASGSESPSLLLSHWNAQGGADPGDMKGKEMHEGESEKEKEAGPKNGTKREKETEPRDEGNEESLLSPLTRGSPAALPDGRGEQKRTEEGEEGEKSEGRVDGKLCGDDSREDAKRQAGEKRESQQNCKSTVKEENGECVSLLRDSCTLVEGLLFPAEYYVRTTRRMTSSQSQPDMQAVILSQLSTGRHRRSRGRGGAPDRRPSNSRKSSQPSQAASPRGANVDDWSAEPASNGQSSGEVLEHSSQIDASPSPAVCPTRRGRRKGRGRGRGRPQAQRCSRSSNTAQRTLEQTPEGPQPTGPQVSSISSVSLRGDDGPETAVPASGNAPPVSAGSTAAPPGAAVNGGQSQGGAASGHQGRIYPIFLTRSSQANASASAESWRPLLLPSSSATQSPVFPLPPLTLLVNTLASFDIPQDFHLPDDQFASLKLNKLRRVALEPGVECFTSPASSRRTAPHFASAEPAMPLPLPLSLTPTAENSPQLKEGSDGVTQSKDPRSVSVEEKLTAGSTGSPQAEGPPDTGESPGEQPAGARSDEFVSAVQDSAPGCPDRYEERLPATLNADSRSSDARGCTGKPRPAGSVAHQPEGQARDDVEARCLEHQQEEEEADHNTLRLPDRPPPRESSEDPPDDRRTSQTPEAPREELGCATSPAADLTANPVRDEKDETHSRRRSVRSQLLLSPPVASAPCPFLTPHLPSTALPLTPPLPSLGLTPHSIPAALPLTSSSSAPSLTLPPVHSPSTQALSPPVLSPCPPLTPPTLSPPPPVSGSPSCQASPAIPATGSQPGACGREVAGTEEHVRRTHTLKAPAGGSLVDACCLLGSSGSLCVAAAGKWAVCLWSPTSASDWSLTHTWTFGEPVISVFPVPDAAGLLCVTLGQLEIREVRMLSCSRLSQALLCEGVVQAVVGVSRSRAVASSHSASGSTLQAFTLSDTSSRPSSQLLASPGACVGSLAPVDGLPDALIGTDAGGRLFIWNLKTGQLLRSIALGEGLSHSACLRGFSCCGALLVLLQHQLLSSLGEDDEKAKAKDDEFSKDEEEEDGRRKTAVFSLVAVNPLSGKSAVATRLHPPEGWSGRLCEADASRSGVLGLSQSGCACVWEPGRRRHHRRGWAPTLLPAPESGEGWHLARWGSGDTLVTGHHNGDVTLHPCDTVSAASFIK